MKKIKTKKCANKECNNSYKQFNSLVTWCSTECKISITQTKEAQKIIKSKRSLNKPKSKTLDQYEIEAKEVFQKWVRLRDAHHGFGCISCVKDKNTKMDGGHVFKAELYSGLIFNELNCHGQCVPCNRFEDGNVKEAKSGIEKRYGNEALEYIESRSDANRLHRYDKNKLIAIKLKYQIKIKENNFDLPWKLK